MTKKSLYQNIQKCFANLANPLKFKIFLKILQEGCDCDIDNQKGFTGNCVTNISSNLKIPQSTVSSYIRSLQNSSLIKCKKNGKFLYCKPSKETLINIKSFIDSGLTQIRQ